MSTVRIPRAEDDAFPWARTALATVVGAALGLALAHAGMERAPVVDSLEGDGELEVSAPQEPPAVEEPAVEEPVDEAAIDEPAVAVAEPAVEEPAVEEPAIVDSPVDEPTVSAPEPSLPPAVAQTSLGSATGRTLQRGRVAYLRCDGVPQGAGPFPCPRDEALEEHAWRELEALTRCSALTGPGQADVVLDYDGARTPTVRTRDTFPSDAVLLDPAAVLTCASAGLGTVQTRFSPRRMVVSLRLALE